MEKQMTLADYKFAIKVPLEPSVTKTRRDRIDDACSEGLQILRDFDKKYSNILYTNEYDLKRISTVLADDIDPLFDEIIGQIGEYTKIEIYKCLFYYKITTLKIRHFMELYIKHCSLADRRERLRTAKTIVMMFPCDTIKEIGATKDKPQDIVAEGAKLKNKIHGGYFKESESVIVHLSGYLFDIISKHSLKEEYYTKEEIDIICYLAYYYFDNIVYPKSKDQVPMTNPYLRALEEQLLYVFKNWKPNDSELYVIRSKIQSKYNQRMAKETAEHYQKNKQKVKTPIPNTGYVQMNLFNQ